MDPFRVDRWLYSSWSSARVLFRSTASGANWERTRPTRCLRIQPWGLCCCVLLGWLASHATAEELFLPWRQGWWVLPLGIGYSIAFRVILAVVGMITILFLVVTHLVGSLRNVAVQIRTRVDHLVDFSALQTNRIYYWLVLTLVSFVGAGSVRNCGELRPWQECGRFGHGHFYRPPERLLRSL